MMAIAAVLVAVPGFVIAYAYLGYPLLLKVLSLGRRGVNQGAGALDEWPEVSVSLPAYNEEETIRGALDALLAADYPSDRLQILVVSDASTDRTDEIVREYEDAGVELLRVESRGGKTAAENAAVPHLRGEIVVNTDASVRIEPDAVKALVRQFTDPVVGVASGRDVSVAGSDTEGKVNAGEAGYVNYEMWVRSLETRTGGIIGASGCLYAIRRELHSVHVPEHLSRDFCAALTAREHGYRAISVSDAVCRVPRTGSLAGEFQRKVRTIVRGLQTLAHKRDLLDPLRYGGFALKLWSHKLARWTGAAVAPLAVIGLLLSSSSSVLVLSLLGTILLTAGGALLAFRIPAAAEASRLIRFCGYLYAANLAAALACWRVIREERRAVWEPTRR